MTLDQALQLKKGDAVQININGAYESRSIPAKVVFPAGDLQSHMGTDFYWISVEYKERGDKHISTFASHFLTKRN